MRHAETVKKRRRGSTGQSSLRPRARRVRFERRAAGFQIPGLFLAWLATAQRMECRLRISQHISRKGSRGAEDARTLLGRISLQFFGGPRSVLESRGMKL